MIPDFAAGLAHLAVGVLQRAGADSGVRRPELDGVVIAASREDHLVRGHRACHTHIEDTHCTSFHDEGHKH